MLELRPTCEHCNKKLPPNSSEAMICSYECTFCQPCVDEVLENVCPNCGGDFCARPIRPQNNLKNGNFLGNNPASSTPVYKPVNIDSHRTFSVNIKKTPPVER